MTSGVDLGLLPFNNYDEYIRSFTNLDDYRYFPDMKSLKHFLKIGYRSTSKIYGVDEFLKMKVKIADFLNPKISSRVLYGSYIKGDDAALLALAEREEPNLNKKLSVIGYINFSLSGMTYIYICRQSYSCRCVCVADSIYRAISITRKVCGIVAWRFRIIQIGRPYSRVANYCDQSQPILVSLIGTKEPFVPQIPKVGKQFRVP